MPGQELKPWEQPLTAGAPQPQAGAGGPGALMQLLRMLPGMGKFGMMNEDIHLPMQVGDQRDPRLGEPSGFDAIRGGLEQVHDLGKTPMTAPEDTAMKSIQRMAGSLKR